MSYTIGYIFTLFIKYDHSNHVRHLVDSFCSIFRGDFGLPTWLRYILYSLGILNSVLLEQVRTVIHTSVREPRNSYAQNVETKLCWDKMYCDKVSVPSSTQCPRTVMLKINYNFQIIEIIFFLKVKELRHR